MAATEKSSKAFRTISEVADELTVPQHVLRFWESKFSQINPLKRGGNRRYYRPEDVDLLKAIRFHLHDRGFTIKGVQKLLREMGQKQFVGVWKNGNSGLDIALAGTTGTESQTDSAPASAPLQKSQEQELQAVLSDLKAVRRMLDDL